MTNARSIIEAAARKINVVGRGQVMPADEAQSALEALNDLLGNFTAEAGLIFNNTTENFALTGATSYTIGVGGDFNTARPIVIESAFIRIGNIDYPLQQINSEDYNAIGFKNLTGVPEQFYYFDNVPIGSIFLYPIGVAGYQLYITSRKALTEFEDLTTDYSLPPGFKDMLIYNLAVRLSPEYEKPVTPDLLAEARRTRSVMEGYTKRNSYPTANTDFDGSNDTGNIYSGWFIP